MERLRAAVIDGRTANVRYRQNELLSLHSILRENADQICAAIAKDASDGAFSLSESNSEADIEYYLAMDATRQFYQALDFKHALKEEYLIASGLDNPSWRVGKGLVVIKPTEHTRFYSVICPLAAAIAAGNCVYVQVSQKDFGFIHLQKLMLVIARRNTFKCRQTLN